ncbi:GNAT family N-acetyltransferase [Alkalithermobacter paradoxus]|uniref:N-acetyltransferase domain-containing protein n=1 Tax=Alkalithermobacter paradoxus TaxID=29349 RepID=A0A1V4IB53_9FIRM|nr:hypothetical protein CLOTH_04940 [[Clostridium] thermoalcaliphilum]
MLKITRINKEDKSVVESILNRELDTQSLHNLLAIYDDKNILGCASYKTEDGIAYLKDFIVLDKTSEGILKDGLIKSLLNLADLNGIKLFLIKKDINEKFFKKIGFMDLSEREFIVSENLKDEEYIYAILPDFFNTACHSKKRS